MGEIADMMLEGTLCERCGAFVEDNYDDMDEEGVIQPPGFPRRCDACKSREVCDG
jgi:hypothetical protein